MLISKQRVTGYQDSLYKRLFDTMPLTGKEPQKDPIRAVLNIRGNFRILKQILLHKHKKVYKIIGAGKQKLSIQASRKPG